MCIHTYIYYFSYSFLLCYYEIVSVVSCSIYTVGHYCLPILYTVVYICQNQISNLSLPLSPCNYKFVFYVCKSVLSCK